MKWQIEQLDLLEPWPLFTLRDGNDGIRVTVRIGSAPVGEVFAKTRRRRILSHRRLRRLIARLPDGPLLKSITHDALALAPDAIAAMALDVSRITPGGIPEPTRSWIRQSQSTITWRLPDVTIALYTCDRPEALERCIAHLHALDYPRFEVLVLDNSLDPVPAREIAERMDVTYVRSSAGGVSRARNVAMAQAAHSWVAFIDDDCRPEPHWLKELVRPVQDSGCRCVCGSVLPGQLEQAASSTAVPGVARNYESRIIDSTFLGASAMTAAATWQIGSASNMLVHRDTCNSLGGFDESLGVGRGCVGAGAEVADLFYRLLRGGHIIHSTPRAVVWQSEHLTPAAIRRRVYARAAGHAVYLARCLVRYGDHRALFRLAWVLPKEFGRSVAGALTGHSRYPLALALLEMKGTLTGPFHYAATRLRRLRKARRASKPAPAAATSPVLALPAVAEVEYEVFSGTESVRAA